MKQLHLLKNIACENNYWYINVISQRQICCDATIQSTVPLTNATLYIGVKDQTISL